MLETQSGVGLITVVEAGRTLVLAAAALKHKPNRTSLAEFQKAHWDLNRHAMGLSKIDVAVDDCPENWTDGEIRRFTKTDLGLFLPKVVSTAPEGLVLLSKAYPAMRWVEQNVPSSVLNVDEEGNEISLFGWLKPEKHTRAPFTGTDESKARAAIAGKHRLAQTLNVYGEAGQQSKLREGQYLDEVDTWVRVLSSWVRGRVVGARFYPNGYCYVDWNLGPVDVYEYLGVRSVGV